MSIIKRIDNEVGNNINRKTYSFEIETSKCGLKRIRTKSCGSPCVTPLVCFTFVTSQ